MNSGAERLPFSLTPNYEAAEKSVIVGWRESRRERESERDNQTKRTDYLSADRNSIILR